MKSDDVSRLVQREIGEYEYGAPEPGTTVGLPWPEAKILSFIPLLKDALVTPYEQRFYLRDTVEQVKAPSAEGVMYWVVAKTDTYIEFYDPENQEFGLACEGSAGDLPTTIGVRGDLVGVFAAM